MSDDIKALHARITGRVQGVGFRAWTLREAVRLGLSGWVRNEADGAVLALIAGPGEAVDAMVERLWRGPALSSVTGVEIEPVVPERLPDGFRIDS